MAQQLSFDLPSKPALGRDDFFVSPANEVAVAMVEGGTPWPQGKLALCGPAGSGKTHLAHVWAAQSGAPIIQATALTEGQVEALATGPLVIEDVPLIAQDEEAQTALFHLHNLALAQGHALLMTGRAAPTDWQLSLPDLQSRIEGTATAILDLPDDMLLSIVIAKLFADRQITPKPEVIPYLVKRIDRSFAAAGALVDALDRATLTEGRSLTRSFASQVLGLDDKPA